MASEIQFNPAPVSIVRRLVEHGYEAYIVGGAVRDLLLNRQPKDYDITTSATPEEVRQVFGRRQCRIIGRRFRLALVYHGIDLYEVSTFRREPTLNERKGRPGDEGLMIWDDNQFGTLEDDVHRRDFTVNALYYDVFDGAVVDMLGGLDDLRRRLVRSIGEPERRFNEDPVRMLRALKLVGQHHFTLSEDVERAIRRNGHLIQQASPARLFEELMKLLFSDRAHSIFAACHQYGFLKHFFPVLDSLWETGGGAMIYELLKQRDECLDTEDDYFEDKSLALATLCIPYLLTSFDLERVGNMRASGEDRENCLKAIREFFAVFDVPRELTYDLMSLAIMIPSLATGAGVQRHRRSKLYPLGYELFRLMTMASGWMSEQFSSLPLPNESSDLDVMDDEVVSVEGRENDDEDEGGESPVKRRRRRNHHHKG